MKPRVLLAWESGAGRGHLVTLKTVAAALGDGFVYDAALCRMDHAAELAPLCELVFPGAVLNYDRTRRVGPRAVRTATWGEFLGDCGFRDPVFLARQVGWWRQVLQARCTDLLVADYSPCALLAAHSLDIPALAIGTGYGIPPSGLETFPIFLPEFSECLYDEAEMVSTLNAALAPLGVPPLRHLSDVYRRSQDLVRTLDVLDPYAGQREQPLLPPVADVVRPPDDAGDEIFVYFSTSELDDAGVLAAVCAMGVPVRAFCPGIEADKARRLAAAGVILEMAPVPAELLVKRSRMLLHAGQHGVLSMGLAAGLPQVAVPQHLEHLFHARRAEAVGCARVAGVSQRAAVVLASTIMEVYESEGMRRHTREQAWAVREQFVVDPARLIRERVMSVL